MKLSQFSIIIHRNWISQCMVTFYGGEPLMNLPAIERMGTRLRRYCDDWW